MASSGGMWVKIAASTSGGRPGLIGRLVLRVAQRLNDGFAGPDVGTRLSIEEADDKIRGYTQYEYAYGWGADGLVRVSKRGTRNAVALWPDEQAALRGGKATHNHRYGDSFSPADITLARTLDLTEVRVATQDPRTGRPLTYIMTKPAGGWDIRMPTGETLQAFWDRQWPQYAAVAQTPAELAMATHALWTVVKALTGIPYQVVRG